MKLQTKKNRDGEHPQKPPWVNYHPVGPRTILQLHTDNTSKAFGRGVDKRVYKTNIKQTHCPENPRKYTDKAKYHAGTKHQSKEHRRPARARRQCHRRRTVSSTWLLLSLEQQWMVLSSNERSWAAMLGLEQQWVVLSSSKWSWAAV